MALAGRHRTEPARPLVSQARITLQATSPGIALRRRSSRMTGAGQRAASQRPGSRQTASPSWERKLAAIAAGRRSCDIDERPSLHNLKPDPWERQLAVIAAGSRSCDIDERPSLHNLKPDPWERHPAVIAAGSRSCDIDERPSRRNLKSDPWERHPAATDLRRRSTRKTSTARFAASRMWSPFSPQIQPTWRAASPCRALVHSAGVRLLPKGWSLWNSQSRNVTREPTRCEESRRRFPCRSTQTTAIALISCCKISKS